MLWLDHKIFGNGYGLKSPYFDDVYYWLSGRFYTWSGWYGAQLQSFQWRHPRPGETRKLFGREFKPFFSERRFWWLWRGTIFTFPLPICRVRVSWATNLPDEIDAANSEIRQMQEQLARI